MRRNDPLDGMTPEQRRWVMARVMTHSDAEAARAVGVLPSTVCRWANKAELDAKVAELINDNGQQAIAVLRDALVRAALVKVSGLKSHSEQIRQNTASEIMDRLLGKAVQPNEHSGPDGEAIKIDASAKLGAFSDDELNQLAELARRLAIPGEGAAEA